MDIPILSSWEEGPHAPGLHEVPPPGWGTMTNTRAGVAPAPIPISLGGSTLRSYRARYKGGRSLTSSRRPVLVGMKSQMRRSPIAVEFDPHPIGGHTTNRAFEVTRQGSDRGRKVRQ